ncbi:MAG: hypothetical protein Q8L39_10060 [Burkholderiales bacterium]|nr:hypothetical protein [Burkholderiales bacterium]
MTWFQKEMDYARESLVKVSESAIDRAADKLNGVVRDGIEHASTELREVVEHTSEKIDTKLDKISNELHDQRQFTKSDVKELVDYAADKLGATIDDRVHMMKQEITALVQEKVEYFKHEVDSFFVQRQQDIARERRRLFMNIFIAVGASFLMGGVSLMYHRYSAGTVDLFGIFRIVFISLAAGYLAYMAATMLRRYRQMTEHKKDVMFLAMKYWGFLRPESIFGHLLLVVVLLVLYVVMFYPEMLVQLTGNETLGRWVNTLHGKP